LSLIAVECIDQTSHNILFTTKPDLPWPVILQAALNTVSFWQEPQPISLPVNCIEFTNSWWVLICMSVCRYVQGAVVPCSLVTDLWWNRILVDACVSVCETVSKQSTCLLWNDCYSSQ